MTDLDVADSDDTPEEQQLLMTAWQALAAYVSTCDDDDRPDAIQALLVVSSLMSDDDDEAPAAGAFNASTQTAAASTYSCPKCERNFSTEAGLISHLAKLHAEREHQTKATPANDKD